MMEPILPSVLTVEAEIGAVEGIAVPSEYVDPLVAEMTEAGRDDLVSLVTVGDAGRLVVTAAGRGWPFGGL